MKKNCMATVLILILIIMCMPADACAAFDPLTDKNTYYTAEEDYIPGDCILTATRMMIRRAAIMRGKSGWDMITNEVLRRDATQDDCLLSSFSFESEGLSYNVGFGTFEGQDSASRINEFEVLLKDHPEGIVVHGDEAASTGMHGVLVTGVEGGKVYTVDASYNMGMFSEGIQEWKDTTMLDPILVTRYWYIESITKYVRTPEELALKRLHFNMLRCS